jgi:hypothetical protein
LIAGMRSAFGSDLFALSKDSGFESAVRQIEQSFNNVELYPTLEEKAATLLYLSARPASCISWTGITCFSMTASNP